MSFRVSTQTQASLCILEYIIIFSDATFSKVHGLTAYRWIMFSNNFIVGADTANGPRLWLAEEAETGAIWCALTQS